MNDPKESQKPGKVIQGMINGRINKELKEICLLDQVYVKAEDGKQSVQAFVDSVAKVNGAKISIKKFVRFETGELFGDESHIIYVNSQIKDESALGKLMHDFSCTDAKDMKYKILADRVRYFKEDEKGVATMCRAMEEMRNETARETEHAKAIKVAKGMLQSGKLSYEEIAEIAELSIDEVKALDEKVIA